MAFEVAEIEALTVALDKVGPAAATSCPGWTAHHIAAHMAGNIEEARRHVDAWGAGTPLTGTRSFEEREQPLRELPFPELIHRIERDETALEHDVNAAAAVSPDATLRWTGRTVPVSGLATHMRSEAAVHRWDLVGDDDVSATLLGQHVLLEHAVSFIGRPLLVRGLVSPAYGGDPVEVRIAARDQPDHLVVRSSGGDGALALADPDARDADVEADAAARLLMLWGRKPEPFNRVVALAGEERLGRAQQLLSGY